MCASSGRSGGKDQRTPPRAGGRHIEMPPSRFIIGRLSVHLYACKHARMHARHGRQFAVLCICLCLYGDESLMRQAPTIRTCIRNGTSRIDYLSLEEASGSENLSDAFLRFSHVASYKISFASCSLTRADVNAHLTRNTRYFIKY